jgi:hypothetical protein
MKEDLWSAWCRFLWSLRVTVSFSATSHYSIYKAEMNMKRKVRIKFHDNEGRLTGIAVCVVAGSSSVILGNASVIAWGILGKCLGNALGMFG